MFQPLFYIVSNASIVVFFTLSLIFTVVPLPKDPWLRNYKISIRVLSVLFFIMGLFSAIMRWLNLAETAVEIIPFSSLFISTIQVQLFVITLINLFNPRYTHFRNMLIQGSPILFFTLCYTISASVFGDHSVFSIADLNAYAFTPTLIVRELFFVFFVFQVISYIVIFFKEIHGYEREIDDYFSETHQLRLEWVKYIFISSLVLTSIAISYFFYYSPAFHSLFVVLYTGFYFVFALKYLRYTSLYTMIKPAIDMAQTDQVTKERRGQELTWETLKAEIIARKLYMHSGITIEDVAKELRINRKQLSSFINTAEQVNFNSWINRLRIEEAKSILSETPLISLAELSEKVGFTEQSNFSRQFKMIVNVSPSVWRTNNQKR